MVDSAAPSSAILADYSKFKNVLVNAKKGEVVTRFPPEPSGYLHVGHIKAAMLNFHYAKMWEGQMILRFDDTNPINEKGEFVENIIRDLKRLDIVPDRVTHTSDSFEVIEKACRKLIADGNAYADDTPAEQMKTERDAGIESKHRQNTPEFNMKIFDEMLSGKTKTFCIRAKMNMQDKVKCLRDPVFYRCKDEEHHRTGKKYKAYPTYDMACPVVDSLEGVTHALRTIEYRDRNALYAWVQQKCELRPVIIYDYSKLCLISTVLSKRKLRWFVESGNVEGWDDPRFPTVQGIMRRGMTVEALRNFMLEQGPSKNTNLQEWDKIWALNKDLVDPVAKRFTAIAEHTACRLTIENGPETIEARSQALHPKDASIGTKAVIYGKELLIERDDA
jgi:glutamyl-tRNA synthetase